MLYALILYESGGTYNLTSTLNDRFFWESFSWQFYLLSEFLAEICWEKITEEIFLFIFLFYAWPGIRTRSLRLRSQHYTNRHTFDYSLILQQYLKSYLSPLKYKKNLLWCIYHIILLFPTQITLLGYFQSFILHWLLYDFSFSEYRVKTLSCHHFFHDDGIEIFYIL